MKSILWLSLASLLFFAGCVKETYIAPESTSVSDQYYSRVIDKPFDRTWSALIQYTSSAYFDIQQFEKQSGLLVLSFVGSAPGYYVTGGHWKTSGVKFFSGDYVDYCTQFVGGYLENKVNIIVAPVDSGKTRVTVRAHYVFTCGNEANGIETWSFESGTSDSHVVTNYAAGSGKTITLMPTHKAEKGILEAIQNTN